MSAVRVKNSDSIPSASTKRLAHFSWSFKADLTCCLQSEQTEALELKLRYARQPFIPL